MSCETFTFFLTTGRCTQSPEQHTSAKDLPRNSRSFFCFCFFYISRCHRLGENGNVSKKVLKIQSYRAVSATAEVKQPESCRQSFNLKRTRSPWGTRRAGRIKKFNNSMFYSPGKWDLRMGVSGTCCTLCTHTHKNGWTKKIFMYT